MTATHRGLWVLLLCTVVTACSEVTTASGDDAGAMPAAPSPDAGPPGGSPDGGGDDAASDASAPDAGSDAGSVDASAPDAAPADAGDDMPARLPTTLAESGLYAEGSTSELAPGVLQYSPAYTLWSDGADKTRWLKLPDGAQIDTSDMDAWRFPVGTRVWKEFSREGKRLETRLLQKTEIGWYAIAFAWNGAGTEAVEAPDGMPDVLDTTHDVPSQEHCTDCHESMPDWLLGVSAIQLSGTRAGLTLGQLIADGRLSDPPAADFALPDEPAWNALGYLHANCGTCHNPAGEAFDRVDLDLWLRTDQLTSPIDTESYKTTVGVAFSEVDGPENRIEPGAPADSALIFRMMMRGNEESMPPIGSEVIDQDGIDLVSDWIDTL